jgi:curved DNA-binding protein CbpA
MVNSVAFAPGTLERTPLIYLLASIVDRQLSGTLVFETEAGEKSALSFAAGAPSKLKTAEVFARLGALLVEFGYLDAATCEQSYAEAKAVGSLHGNHLVQTGVIGADTLEHALRTQLLRKLQWACALPPSTAYGFYDNQDFLARWAGQGVRLSPLLAIWHLVRNCSQLPDFAERLACHASQPVMLARGAKLVAFGFDAAECAVLETIAHEPKPFVALRRANRVSEPVLQRLIYVLSLTRHLELQGEGERPPLLGFGSSLLDCVGRLDSAPGRCSAAPPVSISDPIGSQPPSVASQQDAPPDGDGKDAELAERRRLIRDLASRYDTIDHYELLGIARDATAAQIQAAFLEAAKRYHPDKLGAELADLRTPSAKLFARVAEARQTLSDPNARQQYDARLDQRQPRDQSEQDEQQRIHEIVNAATSFQKAEVFFKKRMLAAAEQEARRAYEADPEQAEYLALLAWINANKPDSANLLSDVLFQLNTAVRMSPESEKTRFYRAQVLSRLGRNLEAVADYKFVVGKNPHNIDAQRELRLWEMRQKKLQTGGFGSRESAGRASQNFAQGPGAMRATSPGHSTSPAPASSQSQQNPAPSKGGVFSKLFKK